LVRASLDAGQLRTNCLRCRACPDSPACASASSSRPRYLRNEAFLTYARGRRILIHTCG
jgi:hypothetical protein